jgi:phosphatidylglycerol:prolipoprotein diacylglycerol transferase
LYEAIFEGIILFLLLGHFNKKGYLKNPGQISGSFLIFYSSFRFMVEFFRSPDPQLGYIFLNLTLGQVLSIIFLILGGILFFCKKNEK